MTLIRHGRLYLLDGHPVPSVTTILDTLAKPALTRWAANETAKAAIDTWDELAALDPVARYERLKGAAWERRDTAALRGTRIHTLGEKLVRGETVDVPAEHRTVAESYAHWMDTWNPQPVLVETPVASREHQYAGTLDLVADLADGQRWLLDLKTGSGVYDTHALQLAGYRGAQITNNPDTPMPKVNACGVIHVTPEQTRLIPLAVDKRAWTAFLAARRAYTWAEDCRQAYKDQLFWPVGEPLLAPPLRAVS